MRECNRTTIRGPCGVLIESLRIGNLGELTWWFSGVEIQQPQTGAAVSFTLKNNPMAVRSKHRIEIFCCVAYRICNCTGTTTIRRHDPELAQQIENDGPAIRRDVEAEFGAFVYTNADGLRPVLHFLLGQGKRRE